MLRWVKQWNTIRGTCWLSQICAREDSRNGLTAHKTASQRWILCDQSCSVICGKVLCASNAYSINSTSTSTSLHHLHNFRHLSMATSQSCRMCRHILRDSFKSLTKPPTRTRLDVRGWQRSQNLVRASTTPRHIHTRAALRQEQEIPKPLDQDTGIPESTEQDHSKLDTADAESSMPWYLQIETPSPPISNTIRPLLAAQEIPPLPEDPPEILGPILNQLSIQIGLDHLTILDLRSLDPPSALGANLLMILGTARSTKHLNTSADRFCRWLRATYNLRPYADGLLGRNELKLKLRRKNRKLKLAQSVGNTTAVPSDYDDGIGTGWICCNLGSVENARLPQSHAQSTDGQEKIEKEEISVLSPRDQERILDDEEAEYKNPDSAPSESDFKYQGFGSESYAPRIVVQMFTEEKRLEMDLEGLWDARIVRREIKKDKNDQDFQDARMRGELEEPEDADRDGDVDGNVPGQSRIEAAIRQTEREGSLLKNVAPFSTAAV